MQTRRRCTVADVCGLACASLTAYACGAQSIMEACVADIQAVYERDAACDRYTQCILYFKGFQAIQCHRIAHWLWTRNRRVRPRATHPRAVQPEGACWAALRNKLTFCTRCRY